MTPRRSRPSPYLDLLAPGLYIFVPALMSVGFVFWLAALARDQFRRRRAAALECRSIIAGSTLAALTRGQEPPSPTGLLRPGQRLFYGLTAAVFTGLALYVLIGAVANYLRPRGYSAEIAWLLAASLLLVIAFAWIGVLLALVTYHWSALPPRLHRVVIRFPLGSAIPTDKLATPSPAISLALLLTGGVTALLVMVVASSQSFLARGDEPLLRVIAEADWLGPLDRVDLIGSTIFAIVAAALLGLASFRCRVLVFSYPLAVGAGILLNNALKLIGRLRPPQGPAAGLVDSFPSGHVLQATILAGLFPLSVAVMAHSTRTLRPLRWMTAAAVFVTAVHRLHQQEHWPTDVLGSLLIGATIVLTVEWAVGHEAWHVRCVGCPWHGEVAPSALRRGSVPMPLTVARALGLASHAAAAGVAILLVVLSFSRGLPANPEGALIDQAIQRPAQLALAGLVSIAAVLSWRWVRLGAVLLAIAATGLGFLAAVEYRPVYSVAMTVVVLIPAVLLWLSWQHRRKPSEIVTLAVVTGILVGGTWMGASTVYDASFGATHPDSAAVLLPQDRVRWMWLGGLNDDHVTAVVEVDDEASSVRAIAISDDDSWSSAPVAPDEQGIARLELVGLEPRRDYSLVIEVDGENDEQRGRGSFATPPDGSGDFRFVAAACARSGSNGAVFDAMRAEDPDFYVETGDLHYGNIAEGDPDLFRAAYERLLTEPGQAALYREVPIEYVWDDHDYGPNDADASSPTRDAARSVFRQVVPSHPLESPEGAIHRAFTVGRVRFIVSDTRSERTDTTMLGADQLAWFQRELVHGAQTHPLVIWVSPTPWIGAAEPGVVADAWNGYESERSQIADVIAGAGIDNLLMIAGDAHMVAFDDGTNSDYSAAGGGGFPVFQAGALDRPGSVKGGPYSGGTFPGGGQYGLVEVNDDGSALTVTITGKTWEGEILLAERLVFGPG